MASRASIPVDAIDELFKALSVVAWTVDHVLQDRAVEEALGGPVSYSKVQILRLLSHRGGQTSSQIARFLGITRPSVSQIADALERAGWVKRRASQHDGRESVLELSNEGRRQFNVVRRQQRHLLRNMLRVSNQREAQAWTGMLQEIAGSLARADRGFTHFCLQCGAHADGTCVLLGGDADCPFLHHHEHEGHAVGRRPGRGRAR